ncbi:amino acid ABC transporter ATP-binding/permease protein [Dactylosporangium salmoneum]|uniref:amino acid ABC transporter ATP-binding/permease protein n=1 Tax=Dactylosporangium salmoneum TaxID=53361 RepID=UPI0031DF9D7B
MRPAAGRLGVALVAGIAAAGAAVGLMATSAWLISRAAQHPPVLHLMVAIVAVRAFGIGRGVLRYAERLAGHDAALRMLGALRVRVFRRLVPLAPAGLRGFRRGDVAVRLAADVDAVVDLVVRVFLPIAVAAVTGLAAVLLVGALVPAAGAALAVGLVVAGVGVPLLQAALARRADARLAPLRGALAAGATDLVHGLPDLIAAGAVDAALEELERTDRELVAANRRSAALTGVSAAVTALCVGLSVLAGLVAGAIAVRAGSLPGELLAVVVLTPLAVFETVAVVPVAAQGLAAARAALARLAELTNLADPTPDPASPAGLPPPIAAALRPVVALRPVPARAADPSKPSGEAAGPKRDRIAQDSASDAEASRAGGAAHLGGNAQPRTAGTDGPGTASGAVLRLENVTAGWVEGRPVVRDLSFEVGAGRRVALVGPSGAGKTTVAALLLRWLDPAAGRVTLGGVDLRELSGDDVRRVVGLLSDDAYLFDTTIEANLRVGRAEATEEELFAALRAARIDGWVRSLPDGLGTLVGEHGAAVSGGQRRRLALARVLLAGFPVLVLDEPTEHLDEQTAGELLDDLLDATVGRTVVLITHRTDVADRVDDVVVLEQSRPAAAA